MKFTNQLHKALYQEFENISKYEMPITVPVHPSMIPAQNEFKKESELLVANGFTEAILGFNPGGPGNPINQIDTLQLNLRYYLVSNFRQILSQAYAEQGIVATVIDVPVDDGLRGGITIKSDELDEDDIKKLGVEVERQDILNNSVGRAAKWNRLFGGAGIIIMTDQDPAEPLDLDAIGEDSPLEFRAVDMWELFWDKQNAEGYDATIQEEQFDHYNYYGTKLHKTRVMKLKGRAAPSFIRPRLRGWGMSEVEMLINSINQYLKANNLIFEVLDEFKVDVYKLKDLASTMASVQGENLVRRRMQMVNQVKNFQNAIILDKEDDFEQKELLFTGIAETMQGIRMQVASDLRMPISKIFGIASTGFSSGEDDIENYNAMVESQVRAKLKFDIIRILEVMCKKMFGFIPEDLTIDFKPLRILTAQAEEEVKTSKFARIFQAVSSGHMNEKDFKDACNKENLLCIQIDSDEELIPQLLPEGDEAGANRTDSAKTKAPKPKTVPKEAAT